MEVDREAHFRDRSSENDNFIEFADSFHELIHTRSLDHVDVVILSFDLDGNGKVCLV